VDVEAWELLSAAHRNAERLLLLVNDLLDLERVGRGELPLEKKDSDLAAVIAAAVDVVQTMAASAGVAIVVHSPSIHLHADAGRLGQVISNVIANAIRYSPRGGTITVIADTAGSRARVTIDDQGPGVPAAFRVSIFEPFKQVEGSAAHKKGGTGLGLAIARALLERHGGVIGVGDAPGGGARFTMELPLRSS
jgi:signal transduction histidine kinase